LNSKAVVLEYKAVSFDSEMNPTDENLNSTAKYVIDGENSKLPVPITTKVLSSNPVHGEMYSARCTRYNIM